MTLRGRIVLAAFVAIAALGLWGWIRVGVERRAAAAELAGVQRRILREAGAVKEREVREIRSDQISSPRIQEAAKAAIAAGAVISSRETGRTKDVVFDVPGAKPVAGPGGAIVCPPLRFHVHHTWENLRFKDAAGKEWLIPGGTYEASEEVTGWGESRPLETEKVELTVAKVAAPTPAPRTLFGVTLLLSQGPSGSGGMLLGEIAPAKWAVSSRWIEGRFKLVAAVEELPAERRYLAGAGFSGGVGRRVSP